MLSKWLFVALTLLLTTRADAQIFGDSTSYNAGNAAALRVRLAEQQGADLIDRTMQALSERAEAFNKALAEVNALNPLDVHHFSQGYRTRSRSGIKKFVDFLHLYRDSASTLSTALEDTLRNIRFNMEPEDSAKFLEAFRQSFHTDVDAFDRYIATLLTLYHHVDRILALFEREPYRLKDSRVVFTNKKIFRTYQSELRKIDSANQDLTKAIQQSREATAWANKTIKEVYEKTKRE